MSDDKIILEYFIDHADKFKGRTFLTQPMGSGKIITFSFEETITQAKKIAGYLASLNLPEKSQIAICSKNCAWWVIADIAIVMAGHISVPIFPTLTKDTTQYTIEHSESKLLFVGKMDDKPYKEMKDGFTDIPKVSFPLCPSEDCAETKWDDLIKADTPALETPVKRSLDEMCTIIYTSGSTGKPKGVMTSFGSMLAATKGMAETLKVTDKDRYLSYLPVAHGMERWTGECIPLYTGEQIFFAESLNTFLDDLNRCKPTLFLSVPRLWTKFQAGIYAKMPEKKLNRLMKIPLISSLLKKVLIKKLGLSKCRMAGSGSAPLPGDVLDWYRNLGLELNEGYGMTENFNYAHCSREGRGKVGFVGECWPGVEHRINESDGEIQVKTPGKMMGYFKNEEATKETFTEDGWVRTGDKGAIEKHNGVELLKITGRTKEIFKTSKGKYVAPAPIETLCINHSLIELALVAGRAQAQPFAILQLSEAPKKKALSSAAAREEFAKELEEHITKVVNPKIEAHERLQCVVIVSDEWSPENGYLTPTQKIKRAVIEEFYGENFDDWYAKKQPVVWYGFDGKADAPKESAAAIPEDSSEEKEIEA